MAADFPGAVHGITMILYPDVPIAPGVPPVLRAVGAVIETVALLAEDAALPLSLIAPSWGIFDQSGAPVALADAVLSFDYRREHRVSDYPIEQGGFSTYNKVQRPYESRVALAKGGPEDERASFLAAVGGAVDSLDLFAIVTPEFTYPSASLVSYDFRREARQGATLLVVEIGLTEIRVTGGTLYSQTAQPDGAAAVNGGTVQPQTPTPAQQSATSRPAAASSASGAPLSAGEVAGNFA